MVFQLNLKAEKGNNMIIDYSTYVLKNDNCGTVVNMTVPQILEYINTGRSSEWLDYDENDWREGLTEFTDLSVVAWANGNGVHNG